MASNRECVSCASGHIHVDVVKGDLTTEKADAIVCTATKNLDLSRGRVSKALLTAGGRILQEDCNTGYPKGIEYGQVAKVNAGKLTCKRVLLVALPVWVKPDREQKILEETINTCLQIAHESKLKSIALPALGTGLLKYPQETVAQITLHCIECFSKSCPKSPVKNVIIVVFPKDTAAFEAFENKIGGSGTASSKKGDNNHKIELPPGLANMSPKEMGMRSIISGRTASEAESEGQIINIRVEADNFSQSQPKAEVLVNIMKSSNDLHEGELGPALLRVAGEHLQDEFDDETHKKGLQPGDVAVTSSRDLKRRFKKIYHCYLPKSKQMYTSLKYIEGIIENCLQRANRDGYRSLVIPAPVIKNCPHNECARVICHSIRNYEEEMMDTDIYKITIFIEKTREWEEIKESYLNAIDKTVQMKDQKRQQSSKDYLYKSLESALKGALERTDKGPDRGTLDWYKFMYKKEPRTPIYWSHFTSNKTVKEWHMGFDDVRISIVPVDRQHFILIEKLVQDTWQSQHVGQGRDSAGLGDLNYTRIKVKTIERIENTILFEKYFQTRQELFRKVIRRGHFHQLKDIQDAKGPILTTQSIGVDSVLADDIYQEINEHYMFHGTQDVMVGVIAEQGLDSRLAGSSSMFGQGVYAAESSTKADQYADTKDSRSQYNRKMFLIRMCMGKIHVQSNAQTFARPPCSRCAQAKCSCGANNYCDSVVGDGSWIFREFVVYDRSQVYPEYIITYDRV